MKHLLPAFIVAFFSLPVAAQNSKFYMYTSIGSGTPKAFLDIPANAGADYVIDKYSIGVNVSHAYSNANNIPSDFKPPFNIMGGDGIRTFILIV